MSNSKPTPPPAGKQSGGGRKPNSEPGPHQAKTGKSGGKPTPFPAAGTKSEPGPH